MVSFGLDGGRLALGCALALSAAACAGHPEQLPPRAPPPRALPAIQLPAAPLQAGMGRVVFDGTDGPMRIVAQADTSFVPPGVGASYTRTGELCPRTPCVADLPVGRYRLYLSSAGGAFNNGDTDELVVGDGVTYYRRAPGRYEAPEWIRVGPAVLVLTGVAMAVTGAVLASSSDSSAHTPGLVVFGGGLVIGTWGAVDAYSLSRAKQQEGATTVWRP